MAIDKTWKIRIHTICEDLDWNVSECRSIWELQKSSPMGEDFSFCIRADSLSEFKDELFFYTEVFDAEEHAIMWYGANRGEPSSLRVLLDDADDILSNIEQLYEAIRSFYLSEFRKSLPL